jgi:hypothetical protein
VIPKGESFDYLIVSAKSGGLASGDNRQDVCKPCKTSEDVQVNLTFKKFQAEKMRLKAGIKATDIPKPLSATGLAAYIKGLVHENTSPKEGLDSEGYIPVKLEVSDPKLKELEREVRNLRRYLNRNLAEQMKKMVEELTEPIDSRLEAIDDEIIRVRKKWVLTMIDSANKASFNLQGKINPSEPFPDDED